MVPRAMEYRYSQVLEHDRDGYIVLGNILCASSRGSDWLIKQETSLRNCVEDILEELQECLATTLDGNSGSSRRTPTNRGRYL